METIISLSQNIKKGKVMCIITSLQVYKFILTAGFSCWLFRGIAILGHLHIHAGSKLSDHSLTISTTGSVSLTVLVYEGKSKLPR